MSVVDTNELDGIAISQDEMNLMLLISDHLDWNNEYEHLCQLQNKINAYLGFLESEQYKEIYPDNNFTGYCIEIHFLFAPTDNCKKFIAAIEAGLAEQNIIIETIVEDG